MIRLATFIIIVIVALSGCKNQEKENVSTSAATPKSRYATLLTKCKDMRFDTLEVYSVSEPEDEDYEFRGVKIDKTDGAYLPEIIKRGLASEMYGTYACGSFAIDNGYTGILLRTPAQYSSNTLNLLILDKSKDTITGVLELSQLFGDAGDFVEKKSWLYKNEQKKLNNFMWMVQTYDHSIEDDSDPTIDRTDNYYVFDITKPSLDTTAKDARELFKTFKPLDRK